MKTKKEQTASSGRTLRLVGRLRRFVLHPVWSYSLPKILCLVKEDWDSEGTRSELEDLIKHMEIHSNYARCGYEKMTERKKALFLAIHRKPWSFESPPNVQEHPAEEAK